MEGTRAAGRRPFMPRKPLEALKGSHATGCWAGGVLTPARLPHGECGVWGGAPRSLTDHNRQAAWKIDARIALRLLCSTVMLYGERSGSANSVHELRFLGLSKCRLSIAVRNRPSRGDPSPNARQLDCRTRSHRGVPGVRSRAACRQRVVRSVRETASRSTTRLPPKRALWAA